MKFLCGLTLGVLGTTAFIYCGDSQDKLFGLVVGAFLGFALLVVTVITFLQWVSKEAEKDKAERNDKRRKEDWWKDGGKPPWEDEDDD
jgi:F0F1-type ATP synthase assembly protein I